MAQHQHLALSHDSYRNATIKQSAVRREEDVGYPVVRSKQGTLSLSASNEASHSGNEQVPMWRTHPSVYSLLLTQLLQYDVRVLIYSLYKEVEEIERLILEELVELLESVEQQELVQLLESVEHIELVQLL